MGGGKAALSVLAASTNHSYPGLHQPFLPQARSTLANKFRTNHVHREDQSNQDPLHTQKPADSSVFTSAYWVLTTIFPRDTSL